MRWRRAPGKPTGEPAPGRYPSHPVVFSAPIIGLHVRAARRRQGAATTEEPCLALGVTRHYYVEAERRWELRESAMFTFTRATLAEAPARGAT
jgi:hypothetical protein